MAIKYSALNLVPIREGEDERTAINDMVKLAQHLDELSYERYWIAEHHNAPNLVSSATALLIQHTLEHTKHIRVGSGGITLPNHAPLIVAEQFGTMATLFPNRVDLGLGRAPGTDMMTASALRRDQHDGVYKFPEEVSLLQQYFGPAHQQAYVRAYPAVGKKCAFIHSWFFNRFCTFSCSQRASICVRWTFCTSTNERSYRNLQNVI